MDIIRAILIYLAIINVVGFAMMGLDKGLAKAHRRRISERTLLMIALVGGALGSLLGMMVFHHKTKHPKFFISIPIMLAVHIGLLVYFLGA